MKTLICVDPGASGGWAIYDHRRDAVVAFKMPENMTEQLDMIKRIPVEYPGAVVVAERTGGYRPGNSGPAACKFARHCGHIEAALYMAGIPTTYVPPGVWMKKLGTFDKEKKIRKKQIQEHVQRLYPHLKATLAVSDALGLLTTVLKEQRPTTTTCDCEPKCGKECKCETNIQVPAAEL